MWEMFTHGQVPYTFISSDSEVAERVLAGARLERPMVPTECPEEVFAVLQRCWAARALDRPAFADIKKLMLEQFKMEGDGECCVCLRRLSTRRLLALVPCGHRCVCADHAPEIVGRTCPICRLPAREAIRVYD